MIDRNKRLEKLRAKEKQRKRIHVDIDPDNYEYIPEQKQTDYYDNDVPQRVAIYVRVSTDDVRQTTSLSCRRNTTKTSLLSIPIGHSLRFMRMKASPVLLLINVMHSMK